MLKTFIFLSALALCQGSEERLTEPHPDCPIYGHLLLPHEYDCSKFYYCEAGEKFIDARDCPPNTEFSNTLQVCVHPTLANCDLTGEPNDSTADSSTDAPIDDSCEYFDNGCPVDFDITVLLPHETSCRKFYFCVRGEKVLNKCAKGTVFNPAIQACDHPINVDRTCEDEDSSSEELSTEESTSSEEIELLPNGCPVDSGISQYLPHENYCNKYYQCIFGELVERRCAPGTHFNPVIQSCDHIEAAGCTLPGGDASSSEEDEVNVPDNGLTTAKPPSDLLDNGCPVDGSISWLVPHEEDCTKFYFCVWGGLVESSCPGGLHFSQALQRCENPAIAGCICKDKECSNENNDASDSDSIEDLPAGDAPNDSDSDEDLPAGDAPTDSESDEDLPAGDAPIDSESDEDLPAGDAPIDSESDEDLPAGDAPSEPDCEEPVTNKCEEECNVLPWAHEDCDKYWQCSDRKPVLVVCSEGLFFNAITNTCDFKCNVDCVRSHVQTTASNDGLRVYLPWDQIDDKTKDLLKLIVN